MEISEFIEETARIEKFYEKELTEFQQKEWYRELKTIPLNRYRQIIMQVYRECKFMPKLADIVSINAELPYGQKKEEVTEKVDCNNCNGTGILFYTKLFDNGNKKIPYQYVARCDCKNGLEFAYDGTQISDTQHRSEFHVPTVTQINL